MTEKTFLTRSGRRSSLIYNNFLLVLPPCSFFSVYPWRNWSQSQKVFVSPPPTCKLKSAPCIMVCFAFFFFPSLLLLQGGWPIRASEGGKGLFAADYDLIPAPSDWSQVARLNCFRRWATSYLTDRVGARPGVSSYTMQGES